MNLKHIGSLEEESFDEVEGKCGCGNLTKEIAVTSVSCHLFAETKKEIKKISKETKL